MKHPMRFGTTPRGFERCDFMDDTGTACSLQASSAIGDRPEAMEQPGTSFVWLGSDEDRMHLDRERVAELVARLSAWLATGSMKIPADAG